MAALRSDDLNYLVFRYLIEAGYTHSAFTFGNESTAKDFKGLPYDFGPGALLDIVQKGLQLKECEECERQGVMTLSNRYTAGDLLRAGRLGQPVAVSESEREGRLALQGHQGPVLRVTWHPSAPLLASSSSDCTGRVWSVPLDSFPVHEDDQVVHCEILQHATHESAGLRDVSSIEWAADGDHVITGAYDGIGRVWGKNGYLRQVWNGHSDAILAVRVSPDGDYAVSASVDKSAIVWHVSTGALLHRVTSHTSAVLAVAWLDGTTFATASRDGAVHAFRVHAPPRSAAHAALKSGAAALGARPGASSPLQQHGDAEHAVEWLRTFKGHASDVNALSASHLEGARLFASVSDDRSAKIWTLSEAARHEHWFSARIKGGPFGTPSRERRTVELHARSVVDAPPVVASLAVTPREQALVGACSDSCMQYQQFACVGNFAAACAIAIMLFVALCDAAPARAQEAATHTLADPALVEDSGSVAHAAAVTTCCFQPGTARGASRAPLLATGSIDCTVKVWTSETGALQHTLSHHTAAVHAAAWNPAADVLASAGLDGQVCVWDVASGELLKSWQMSSEAYDVAWHASGDALAVAVGDGLVEVIKWHRA